MKSKSTNVIDIIAEAKQEETRLRRINKSIPTILMGIGLNDKYVR